MNPWLAEIKAVFLKEWAVERRAKSGWTTSGAFSFVAVIAVALAAYGLKLGEGLAAGMLWVILLFASVVALPRCFISEEEQGTSSLLRLAARPHAVFWGKAAFNLIQIAILGTMITLVYTAMVGVTIVHVWVLLGTLLGGYVALSGTVSVCGALVAQASQRESLAGVLALPMLMPVAALGVGGLRYAFGLGTDQAGLTAMGGLLAYGILQTMAGPWLYAATHRLHTDEQG